MATAPTASGLVDWQTHASCLGCGYSLRGLLEARCPECGQPFDPHDPSTMKVPGWRPPLPPRKPARPITFGDQMAKAALISTIYLCVWPPFGMVAWIGIIIAWVRRSLRVRRTIQTNTPIAGMPEGTWPWRSLVLGILLLGLWIGSWRDRCPHGEYYGFGLIGIGVVRSETAGPCYNHVHGTAVHLFGKWYLFTSGQRT